MIEPTSLIESIRIRPGMYFGEKSLTAFYHFLGGFQFACSLHGIEDNRLGLRFPADFHDWVAYRCRFKESTSGWYKMIVATTDSEEAACDRFFELLKEHAIRVPTLVAEIVKPSSHVSAMRDGREVVLPAPERVQLVRYTSDPGFYALYGTEDFTDGFFPSLSWIWGIGGGEIVIHDKKSYDEMLRENVVG